MFFYLDKVHGIQAADHDADDHAGQDVYKRQVLLTEAFEAVAGASAPASVCVHAAQALGAGAGSRGMVYGLSLIHI